VRILGAKLGVAGFCALDHRAHFLRGEEFGGHRARVSPAPAGREGVDVAAGLATWSRYEEQGRT
jgi:hypothetical protein